MHIYSYIYIYVYMYMVYAYIYIYVYIHIIYVYACRDIHIYICTHYRALPRIPEAQGAIRGLQLRSFGLIPGARLQRHPRLGLRGSPVITLRKVVWVLMYNLRMNSSFGVEKFWVVLLGILTILTKKPIGVHEKAVLVHVRGDPGLQYDLWGQPHKRRKKW